MPEGASHRSVSWWGNIKLDTRTVDILYTVCSRYHSVPEGASHRSVSCRQGASR